MPVVKRNSFMLWVAASPCCVTPALHADDLPSAPKAMAGLSVGDGSGQMANSDPACGRK
jgi:hypothetical protein